MQMDNQKYTRVTLPNALEKYGMAELSGRTNEMAMKMSLIVALARDPYTEIISPDDMEYSINYTRTALDATVECLKISISQSTFESDKKEILADIRRRMPDGMTWTEMQKPPPYSKHKRKDLRDILDSLKDAELIADQPLQRSSPGRPQIQWVALA